MVMKTVPAGEFKTRCLRIMDEVQATGEPYVITKRGRPVARLVPVAPDDTDLFGYMSGTFEIVGDIEESPWQVESGGADAVVEKWERANR